MANVIALIPARSGSKGVLNKNIKELGGKSLLHWAIAACQKSSIIDRIIVSTDSIEYAELAKSAGAECPFIRPKEIALDSSTDIEFVKHALNFFSSRNFFPEFIAHIRPTTPFRDPEVVDRGIKKIMACKSATALRSVHEMAETAYKCFEIGESGNLQLIGGETNIDLANEPRQSYKKTFAPNGYVDVLRSQHIFDKEKIHGEKVLPFVTKPMIQVDTIEEFEMLELLLYKDKTIYNKLFGND